jgi:hypothetical protein
MIVVYFSVVRRSFVSARALQPRGVAFSPRAALRLQERTNGNVPIRARIQARIAVFRLEPQLEYLLR